MTRLPFKQMKSLDLITGVDGDELIVLEIVPTMKTIEYGGKKYHRVPNCHQVMPDGSQRATYLWDGYGAEMLRRMKAKQSD